MSSPHVVALKAAPFTGCRLVLHTTLDTCRERWSAALAAGAGTVFQTWDWNAAWQQHLGARQGVQPRIVELRDTADQTVILWPLGLYPRHGMRVLDFLGEVVTDYRAPVIVAGFPGQDDAASFQTLWDQVVQLAGPADLVDLHRMPATLEDLANPMTGLARSHPTENAYSLLLPGSVGELHARLSSKRLADNRRSLRRLGELGAVTLEPDHADTAHEAVMPVMAEQKSRRWRETGSRDLFAEPGYFAFYRSLHFPETPDARVTVASMTVADSMVATHWGLIFRHRYYWILPTYADGPSARYSCGRLLLQAVVEWSLAQGHRVFDLTVGDEAYKKDWVSEPAPLYSWQAALSLRGHLWLARQQLRAWARNQPVLRRAVRWLRNRRSKPVAASD